MLEMQNKSSSIKMGNSEVRQVRPLYSPTNPTKLEAIGASVDAPDGPVPVILDIHQNLFQQPLNQIPSCRAPGVVGISFDTDIIDLAMASEEKGIILLSIGAYKLGSGAWVYAAGGEIIKETDGCDVKIYPDAAAICLACASDADDKEAVNQLIATVQKHSNGMAENFV